MRHVAVAWLGLGANLDRPADQIRRAVDELARHPDLRVLALSALYRTAPVGGPAGQPDFCNACLACATECDPYTLLEIAHAIERAHHRTRDERWGPRTLDIDLLAFDDRRLDCPRLSLPHPRAHERAFVLRPLADIAPALVLGSAGRVTDLLAGLNTDDIRPWAQR
ncbi:2-amino-4-hydroxy-6-hydroxymethyldihydropteridine diphosphokinase [Salinisphaera sp. T31B1]|uniref:2-amino-4-hydroxy-6- hydroxymethyldihydropteridine diphosphokinase n=1 Tax=Salinisphaera sp. T31B1 TaxID=727963 RepID=UPI00333F6D9A